MNVHPFRATTPDLDFVASPNLFFDEVKRNYSAYVDNGFYQRRGREAMYIYRLTTPLRQHVGIVNTTHVSDYLEGRILKHEHTLAPKEQRMMHLMLQRKAQIKPVLLAYHRHKPLSEFILRWIKKKKVSFATTYYGETHEFWVVADPQSLQQLQQLFGKGVSKCYIADGHHRCSTMALLSHRLEQRAEQPDAMAAHNFILSAYFPFEELDIHDYNRVVQHDERLNLPRLMAQLSTFGAITPLEGYAKPGEAHTITFYMDQHWYALRWHEHVLDKYKTPGQRLDANLVTEELLRTCFGVEDVRTDGRVKYVEGPTGDEGLQKRLGSRPNQVAFCLYPVQQEQLIDIAEAGGVMPPKSTWFEPRIRNGMLVYKFLP